MRNSHLLIKMSTAGYDTMRLVSDGISVSLNSFNFDKNYFYKNVLRLGISENYFSTNL